MRSKVPLFHVVDFTPSVLALLGGVLIAFQLVLPAIAFASLTRAASANPLAFLLLSVAGLVLLIILLVLVSLRFGAARAEHREELQRFKADEAQARRSATTPPTEKVSTITPDVEHVVLTTLAKDPKQRFGSISAFAIALEQASRSTR